MLLQTGKTTTTLSPRTRTYLLTLSPSKMGKKNVKNVSKNKNTKVVNAGAAAAAAALQRAENTVSSSVTLPQQGSQDSNNTSENCNTPLSVGGVQIDLSG